MASARSKPTPVALDAFERLAAGAPPDERWELVRGRVLRMMIGARWEHNRIINNIGYELRRRLDERGSPCRVFLETFRLRSVEQQSSLLPDVIVHCEPLAVGATSLQRPVVLVEVLSDGTSQRDRRDKLAVYRTLPSLQHYVMVTRDAARVEVEVLDRRDDDLGEPRVVEGLDADLTLAAIDVTLPLSSVYRDVLS